MPVVFVFYKGLHCGMIFLYTLININFVFCQR